MSHSEFIDEHDNDDAAVEPLLSPLKSIEPSPAARHQVRVAVAAELNRRSPVRVSASVPWWRRTLQVPVPVALCAEVLVLVYVGWTARLMAIADDPVVSSQAEQRTPTPVLPRMPLANSVENVAADPALPELEYYVTETYLCGIGRVNSESGYSFRE